MDKKTIIVIMFFMLGIGCIKINRIEGFNIENFHATYSFDVYNLTSRVENLDNIFVGEVISLIDVLEYDGSGVPMPYSIYRVRVIENIKGNFQSSYINVTYLGGIIGDTIYSINSEIKLDHELFPEIGETYLFSSSKVKVNNNRLTEGMNIVSTPYSLIWLNGYDSVDSIIKTYKEEYYSIVGNDESGIVFDDGGGGNPTYDGASYSDAIPVESGNYYYKSFKNSYDPVYFTFTLSSMKFIDVYSSYDSFGTEVKVELVNDDYDTIDNDINSGSSDNYAFRLMSMLSGGKYYLKVYKENTETGGSFYLYFNTETECSCVNDFDDLTKSSNSVNNYDEIVYKLEDGFIYSNQFSSAVTMWNNMEQVNIVSHDVITHDLTLYIEKINEANNIAGLWRLGGYVLDGPQGGVELGDLIQINQYYLSTYSNEEQIRIIVHELGHALGMNEFNTYDSILNIGNLNLSTNESYQNIMMQNSLPLSELGSCDKSVYNYLWN